MRYPQSLLFLPGGLCLSIASFLSWPKSPVKQGTCGPWRGYRTSAPLRLVHPQWDYSSLPKSAGRGAGFPVPMSTSKTRDLKAKFFCTRFLFSILKEAVRMQPKLSNCLSSRSNWQVMVFHRAVSPRRDASLAAGSHVWSSAASALGGIHFLPCGKLEILTSGF